MYFIIVGVFFGAGGSTLVSVAAVRPERHREEIVPFNGSGPLTRDYRSPASENKREETKD